MVTNPEPPVEPQPEPEREPPVKETPFKPQETRPLTPLEESAREESTGPQPPAAPDAPDAFEALLRETRDESQAGETEATQPEWLSQYAHLSTPAQPASEPSQEPIPDWLAAYLSAEDFVAGESESAAGQPGQPAEIIPPAPSPAEPVSFDFDAAQFETPPVEAAPSEPAPTGIIPFDFAAAEVEPPPADPLAPDEPAPPAAPEISLPVVAPFLLEDEAELMGGATEKPPEPEPAAPESPPVPLDNLSDIRRALQEEELHTQSLKKPALFQRVTSRLRGTGKLDTSGPVKQPAYETGSLKQPEPEKPARPATGQINLPAGSGQPSAPGEAETGIDENRLLQLGAGAAAAGALFLGEGSEAEPGQAGEPYLLPPGAAPEDFAESPPGASAPETGLAVVPPAPPEETPSPAMPTTSKLTWRQKVSQILTGTPAEQDAGLTDADLERRLGTGALFAAAPEEPAAEAAVAPPEDAASAVLPGAAVAAAGLGAFLAETEPPAVETPLASAPAAPEAPSPAQPGIAPAPWLFEEEAAAEPGPGLTEPEIPEADISEAEWAEDESSGESPTRLSDERMAALFLTGSENTQRVMPGEEPAGPLAGELAAPVENYTDLRAIALTDYSEEEARPPEPYILRRLKQLSPLQIVFLLAFVLADIALVCVLAFVLLYSLLPARSIARLSPAPTPTVYHFGGPFPVSLAMPGGWSFKLEGGEIRDGKWEPTGPEWLQGTNIRRVVALPWNKQLEAVVRASAPGDQIDLTMSNGQTLPYKVMMVMEVPAGQASSLQVDFPALYVVLAHKDTPTRWVILAVPAAEAKAIGAPPP